MRIFVFVFVFVRSFDAVWSLLLRDILYGFLASDAGGGDKDGFLPLLRGASAAPYHTNSRQPYHTMPIVANHTTPCQQQPTTPYPQQPTIPCHTNRQQPYHTMPIVCNHTIHTRRLSRNLQFIHLQTALVYISARNSMQYIALNIAGSMSPSSRQCRM